MVQAFSKGFSHTGLPKSSTSCIPHWQRGRLQSLTSEPELLRCCRWEFLVTAGTRVGAQAHGLSSPMCSLPQLWAQGHSNREGRMLVSRSGLKRHSCRIYSCWSKPGSATPTKVCGPESVLRLSPQNGDSASFHLRMPLSMDIYGNMLSNSGGLLTNKILAQTLLSGSAEKVINQ